MLKWLIFDKAVPDINLDQVIDSIVWSQEFRYNEYSFIQYSQNKYLNIGY